MPDSAIERGTIEGLVSNLLNPKDASYALKGFYNDFKRTSLAYRICSEKVERTFFSHPTTKVTEFDKALKAVLPKHRTIEQLKYMLYQRGLADLAGKIHLFMMERVPGFMRINTTPGTRHQFTVRYTPSGKDLIIKVKSCFDVLGMDLKTGYPTKVLGQVRGKLKLNLEDETARYSHEFLKTDRTLS